MKNSRRSFGRSIVFALLDAMSGAGCGYAASVAVGIALVVNGAVFAFFDNTRSYFKSPKLCYFDRSEE